VLEHSLATCTICTSVWPVKMLLIRCISVQGLQCIAVRFPQLRGWQKGLEPGHPTPKREIFSLKLNSLCEACKRPVAKADICSMFDCVIPCRSWLRTSRCVQPMEVGPLRCRGARAAPLLAERSACGQGQGTGRGAMCCHRLAGAVPHSPYDLAAD
jgi:hypothetical protein